jgi:hypothetical protein
MLSLSHQALETAQDTEKPDKKHVEYARTRSGFLPLALKRD